MVPAAERADGHTNRWRFDPVGADGSVHDQDRAAYLESHLHAVDRAARGGVPVAGYFAWPFLDKFEWAYGYDKRFGLVYVDYDTQVRTIKTSGHRFTELINAHRAAHWPREDGLTWAPRSSL